MKENCPKIENVNKNNKNKNCISKIKDGIKLLKGGFPAIIIKNIDNKITDDNDSDIDLSKLLSINRKKF